MSNNFSLQMPGLPRGNNAIRGFDEVFSAGGALGDVSLSVGGLNYSGGAGNGPFGLGFGNASGERIRRRNQHGTPQYQNDDEFSFGGSVLVRKLDNQGVVVVQAGILEEFNAEVAETTYAFRQLRIVENPQTVQKKLGDYEVHLFCQREENYIKIEHWQLINANVNNDLPVSFWRLVDGSNAVSLLGVSPEACIADPADPGHIYEWLIEEQMAPTGNSEMSYYLDDSTSDYSQKYLSRLCSGQKYPLPAPLCLLQAETRTLIEGANPWYTETHYDYGQYTLPPLNQAPYQLIGQLLQRADVHSNYRAGFEIRTRLLCYHTLVFHRFTDELGTEPVLVSAIRFHYKQDSKLTLLTAVEPLSFYWDKAGNSYRYSAGIPEEIEYIPFQPENQPAYGRVRRSDGGPLVLGDGFSPMDLNGEGIDGYLYADGSTQEYYRVDWNSLKDCLKALREGNTSDLELQYKPDDRKQLLPWGALASNTQHYFSDITGNGNLDYIDLSLRGSYEYNRESERWEKFTPIPGFPTEGFFDPHWVDLTGDGVSDMVTLLGSQIRYYRNLKGEGFAPGIDADIPNDSDLPHNWHNTPDQLITFANILGDGRPHLLKIKRQQVSYWPNLGYGRFGSCVDLPGIEDFGDDFCSDRLLLADLDGSGYVDILYLKPDGIQLYQNQSGQSFANQPVDLALPDGVRYDSLDQVYCADLFGNGTQCLVYGKTSPETQLWFCDLSQGEKPWLLRKKTNNSGAVVELSYKSSAQYYLEDKADGKQWIVRTPFAMPLVEKVITSDQISQSTLTTINRYAHAYYDGEEREFRGFGYSEQQDSLHFDSRDDKHDLDSMPSLIKTWHHLGAINQDDISRKFAEQEYYRDDQQATSLPPGVIMDIDGQTELEAGQTDTDLAERYRQGQMALKGQILRQEIYGMDGSDWSADPYTVQENNATVQIIQPLFSNEYAVVHVRPRESLSYSYERNPADPNYSYSAVLSYDDFGHALKNCAIQYPRRNSLGSDDVIYKEQQILRLAVGIKSVANLEAGSPLLPPDILSNNPGDDIYLLGVPLESQAYIMSAGDQQNDGSTQLELALSYKKPDAGASDLLIAYADLQSLLEDDQDNGNYQIGQGFRFKNTDLTPQLVSWDQEYYWYPTTTPADKMDDSGADDRYAPRNNSQAAVITGVDLGRVGRQALLLPWYSESVAFDKTSVTREYEQLFIDIGWVDDNIVVTDPVTDAMNDAMTNAMTEQGQYINRGSAGSTANEYWWVRSGHVIYQNGKQFFKPIRAYDLLDRVSSVEYDPYWLFPVKETDPLGNVTSIIAIDYQRLQPTAIRDINDNITEVVLDVSGSVIATSSYGSEVSYWKDTSKSPDEFITTERAYAGFAPLEQFAPLIYDSAGMEIILPDLRDICDNPRRYLQNAQVYYHTNPFSWMGYITKSQLRQITGESESGPQAEALWQALIDSSYLGYTGALFSATSQLLTNETTSNLIDLPTELETYVPALQTLLKATPHGEQPVYGGDLTAVEFPRIFHDDLKNITDSSGKVIAISEWQGLWDSLLTAGHIDENSLLSLSVWDLKNADSLGLDSNYQAYQPSLYEHIQGLNTILVQLAYSDGFGRGVQAKRLIEDNRDCMLYQQDAPNVSQLIIQNPNPDPVSPRWLTSGHTVYNNKGEVVKQYEPYFINSEAYVDYKYFEQATDSKVADLAISPVMYYDPLGRVTHSITPKGFLLKHDWTPWMQVSYDADDAFIDSPYFQQNILEQNPNGYYYNQELNDPDRVDPNGVDPDRVLLKNPTTYRSDGDQLSMQGLAYLKTLHNAWTPSYAIMDNRGNTLVSVAIDNHTFSAGDFKDLVKDPEDLINQLQSLDVLNSHNYLGLSCTIPPLFLSGKNNGVSMSSLKNSVQLVGFNRLLTHLLISRQLDAQSVSSDDIQPAMVAGRGIFYSLTPLINSNTGAYTYQLLVELKYLLPESGGAETSLVNPEMMPIPSLQLQGTDYEEQEPLILKRLLECWSRVLGELPTVNGYDDQGRATTITDPRFVWNDASNYSQELFGDQRMINQVELVSS